MAAGDNHATGAAPRLEVLPVPGIGEVTPGADLAELITRAAPWLRDGDVLVVTSKIVSKAEGRLVDLPPGLPERERARADALTAETARPVAARGETRIVATHHGFVMAAAGIDASNVDGSQLVLLPKDPDASARALRATLARRHGLRVAVVVSDTMGRPWRNGLTDVALGAAGIAPLRDHRGETDRFGNQLRLTQVAVVDQLAAAAELVKGKLDQIPVAVVRGLPLPAAAAAGDSNRNGTGTGTGTGDGPGVVATLVRDAAHDMFSLGTAEAWAAGLSAAATLPDAAAHPATVDSPEVRAAVRAALATVTRHGSGSVLSVPEPAGGAEHPAVRCAAAVPGDPAALVHLGCDVHRLRAALAAAGLGSVARFEPPGTVLVEVIAPEHR